MKFKTFAIIAFLVSLNSLSAQTTFDKWPAIKEFHEVLSQTFHPSEEGNLQPIKARSEELMNKATALLKSDMPKEFQTGPVMGASEKLQIKSKALHKMIQAKASDADITKALSEVHEIFHEIVGFCSEKK